METNLPIDAEAFHALLSHQIDNGGREASPEELLRQWRSE